MHKPLFLLLYLGLWVGTAQADEMLGPGVISTPGWESHPAFGPDGQLLFVKSNSNFGDWKILEAQRTAGGWSAPMMADFSGEYLDADPFFSADGQTLYFISDRPSPGKSGNDRDIWKIDRTAEGWGRPVRLPEPINSPGQEWFPRQTAEGLLYFGSDRSGGLGGNDIYIARSTNDGGYVVENLGAPVNTDGNEFEFEPAPNGQYGILMRDCDQGCDGGDLYVTHRRNEGWTEPRNLGARINSQNLEVGPTFSRDGETFYWSSARDMNRQGDIFILPATELFASDGNPDN
ncbi:TolB family protein [Gilvimarinus sp. F26214L]|uniref:TolB family protein n=1 Tax=Gilvimarinus sp. DZF01 TaxID=3461371 RepID=UPI00404612F5